MCYACMCVTMKFKVALVNIFPISYLTDPGMIQRVQERNQQALKRGVACMPATSSFYLGNNSMHICPQRMSLYKDEDH